MNSVQRIINRIETLEMAMYDRDKLSPGDLVEMNIIVTVYTTDFPLDGPLAVALKAKGFNRFEHNGWEKWEHRDIQIRVIYSQD